MPEIFADSFYWIALANPADQWHQAAKDFSKTNPDATLVTTDEVLVEFLNFFAAAGEHTRIVLAKMCYQLMNHPAVVLRPQTRESFSAGFRLYQDRSDKEYSMTDWISMLEMRERDIEEVLTHDRHFSQEGFKILF
jgi:predicted nucleic acid-binding protein